MANKNKATRRSFYFSPKNADLLDFLESQEGLSANEFLIEILRAAQSNTHQTHQPNTESMTNEELYKKLENLISNLKVVQATPDNVVEEDVKVNILIPDDDSIPVIDEASLHIEF